MMIDNPWVDANEASKILGVTKETLSNWREIGYLKPGTHWRTSPESIKNPWQPDVIYRLSWCREEMEYWRSHNAKIEDIERKGVA